jgi:glycosyltransferase involved in cell wall biosynthesis
MLKIIHLIDTLRFGGAESVALNYARSLAEQEVESTLFGRLESTDFKWFASKYAVVIPRFSLREIRRADAIFIHSNRNLLKIFLLNPLLGRRKRIFYVQHLGYAEWKFRLLSMLINRVCSDFIRITPGTENIVNQYIKICSAFIPNFYLLRYTPHERPEIRQTVRKELDISDDQILVLFSGVLKPGKGLEDFLALAAGWAGDRKHQFVVVGDGPEAKKISTYPHKNVLWMGWQADVERFLIAADAYYFLSTNEMMPMALIEALTLGVPVWATVGPVNEYLIDTQEDRALLAVKALRKLSRRRILHIQVLPKLTGVQRISLEIFRALPDDRYDKTILFGGPLTPQTAECMEKFRSTGCKILFSNYLQREIGWWDGRAWAEIYRLCRRERFDIVHTHSTKPGIVGRIAARLAGVPRVVHTVHGVAFHAWEKPWKRAIYFMIEWFASFFSHRITLVSAHYQKYFRAFGQKIYTVYNGVMLPENRGTGQSEDGSLRLLFVGRFEEAKDPLTLLRAFALIVREEKRENIRLTLVGDGSLEADCRAFVVRNELDRKVDFVGWQADVTPFYADHQIFCLSSIHEAFGLCLAEAGSHSLPTVATRVGGIPEVIEDGVTGLLVPPRDPQAMFRAILRLVDDPSLCKKMGAAARKRVAELFSVHRMTEAYKQIYTSKL